MDLSRRTLLQTATMASLAIPAAAAAAQTGKSVAIRDQILLAPDILYFNAANIGPAFRSAIAAQQRGTEEFQANPSREYREKYPPLADGLRARLARRLHVTPQEIALVRNSSEANSVAVRGLALRSGDHIILTAHNHPSTLDTWKLRAAREKLDLTILPVPVQATSGQAIVDAFAAAITPRTRAIFLSHMTNVTGLIYPVAQLAQIARAKGIWLHADGAQTFGWMQLDLAALGVDSYAGSTHKWLMGPLEGGILYVRRDRQDALQPLMLSHGYWLTDEKNLQTAQRYEILGQRDDPKLGAIDATLDAHDAIGEAAIEAKARALALEVRQSFAKIPGVRVVGSLDPALSGPAVAIAMPGKDIAAVRAALWAQAKVATAGSAADNQPLIRISPHIYNSVEDVRRVADLLSKLG
jgi:isopenicillin-N epimerase